jgi:hypothetical protein
MQDSLFSRFRGAYLGALLGASSGTSLGTSLGAIPGAASGAIPGAVLGAVPGAAFRTANWSQQLLTQTARLIDSSFSGSSFSGSKHQDQASHIPDCHIPAYLLPLALLHHDQPQVLQQVLRQLSPDQPEQALAIALLGQTFSLILRERFEPQSLILQLIKDLDLPDHLPPDYLPIVSYLNTAQSWLDQSADLATVTAVASSALSALSASDASSVSRLKSDPGSELPISLSISLLLYCFLSTPDQFQLSWQRWLRVSSDLATRLDTRFDPSLSAALGAISGLYNGLTGLPLGWRQQLWAEANLSLQHWRITSELDLFQQTDRLLAVWSGELDADSAGFKPLHIKITAAPRVIRVF